MPAVIKMELINVNRSRANNAPVKVSKQNLAVIPNRTAVPVSNTIDMNRSMIGRIHNVRPGCGSCGHR